jgi:molybdopterin molybdotransferase
MIALILYIIKDGWEKMEFLKAITAREALEMINAFPSSLHTEVISLSEALGRITAEDIVAHENIPPFSRSLVDGFAIKVKDSQGAKETNPALLFYKGEIRIGEEAKAVLDDGTCIYISTGAMMPEGADGVVMQEYTRRMGDAVEITKTTHKGENIIFNGEDIKAGSTILSGGRRLTPFDLGLLAALGMADVWAFKKLNITLISSGDEIIPVDQQPEPGQIRDINRYTVENALRKAGANVSFVGIARDNPDDIKEHLRAAREGHMILVSGGSSKGERDYITTSIEQLGGTILFHGVNIKPGKPTIFGKLWDKPVFGLPGHPVSCIMALTRFVLPLARRFQGEERAHEKRTTGILTTNIPSSYGIEEYVRVAIAFDDEGCKVTPLFAKSSVISSLSQASGYVIVPEGREGFEQGKEVVAYYFE